jgi:hypothetical protein
MVIAPGKSGIVAIIILADGEFLPENLNSTKTLVFRQGESTNRQLKMLKPFGELADPEILRPKTKPICNYGDDPDLVGSGNPMHQHEDNTWWFYEETWQLEQGPFDTHDDALTALGQYCIEFQAAKESLTNPEKYDKVINNEQKTAKFESPEPGLVDRD